MRDNQVRAVLFDLDGTLVDTAHDLIHALNLSLKEHRFQESDSERLRSAASNGSLYMVSTALPDADNRVHKSVQLSMLRHYEKINGDKGKLFEHMAELLIHLEEHSIPWGIVTNKPARYTRPLIRKLDLIHNLQALISGDSTTRTKPDIAPMYLAAQQLDVAPKEILYIGDAQRDIEAANNSGMISAVALWGYIHELDHPTCWNADYLLKDPREIYSLFKN